MQSFFRDEATFCSLPLGNFFISCDHLKFNLQNANYQNLERSVQSRVVIFVRHTNFLLPYLHVQVLSGALMPVVRKEIGYLIWV